MPDRRQSIVENQKFLRPLAEQRPTEVEAVVKVLAQIRDIADQAQGDAERDGIACFADLYHTITSDVLAAWADGRGHMFRSGKFILELDLAFAQRYLDALRDHLDEGSSAPSCWELTFARRGEKDIEPWQFAVAGVNAHVNFDLAFALLDVWEKHPDDPLATTEEQYADYLAINTIFHNRMDQLCEDNEVPWTRWGRDGGVIDRLGNLVGDFLVVSTRDFAWIHAERWWRHHDEPGYRAGPESFLDAFATKAAELFL
jgi:hypothetical protein